MASDAEIAEIDALLGGDVHWEYLAYDRRLNDLPLAENTLEALRTALGYQLKPFLPRTGPFGPFPPILIAADGTSIPPPREMPEAIKDSWLAIAAGVGSAAARARFNDLVWVAKFGGAPSENGRAAMAAYVELAGNTWEAENEPQEDGSGRRTWGAFRRAQCLVRALEIALELRDDTSASELRESVRTAFRAATVPTIAAAGILLKGLARIPARMRTNDLVDDAEYALSRFGTTAHNFEMFAELAESLWPADRHTSLREAVVVKWLEQSRASIGIAKLVEVQKAAETARQYGIAARLPEIRRELDSLRQQDLGLKTVTVPLEISDEDISAYVGWFVDVESWQHALRRFGAASGPPPSGDLETNRQTVKELQAEFPMASLVSSFMLDGEQRPILHPDEPAQRDVVALARQEIFGISFWSLISVRILGEIRAKFGDLDEEELTAFFTTEIIEPAIAAKVAHAFALYFGRAWDDSAHVLVPRLEAIIRGLASKSGIAVSRETYGTDPGGVAMLGTLLSELTRGGLDPSWCRYLVNVLTDSAGMNLRNRISHGLLEEADQKDAALLLHVALVLRSIRSDPPAAAA